MKKLLSIIMAMSLIMALIVPASADYFPGSQGELLEISFDESTGTLTIDGEGVLPDTVNGCPTWGEYANPEDVKNVVIGENVTGVGSYQFAYCENLVSVTGNVDRIGEAAFKGCSNLSNIDLSTVQSIGDSAFNSASSLTDATITGTIGFNCFSGSGLHNVTLNGCTNIASQAFFNCSSLTSVDLNNVTSIGDYAFAWSGLESVEIPDTVTFVGDNAFEATVLLIAKVSDHGLVNDKTFGDAEVVVYTGITDGEVNLNLSDGSINMVEQGGIYTYTQNGTTIATTNENVTVTSDGETSNNITINGNQNVNLDNVNMSNTGTTTAGITIISGDVAITLIGDNNIDNSNNWLSSGIYVAHDASLTIAGDGSLVAKGGEDMGGIDTRAGSTLTIDSGDITAEGGYRTAGISVPQDSTLIVNGGNIDATGGQWGSGIGGYSNTGTVIINDGTVSATGGDEGAGIGGGGLGGNAGEVIINGGNVNATGTNGGEGIGAGFSGESGTTEIAEEATVVTTDSEYDGSNEMYFAIEDTYEAEEVIEEEPPVMMFAASAMPKPIEEVVEEAPAEEVSFIDNLIDQVVTLFGFTSATVIVEESSVEVPEDAAVILPVKMVTVEEPKQEFIDTPVIKEVPVVAAAPVVEEAPKAVTSVGGAISNLITKAADVAAKVIEATADAIHDVTVGNTTTASDWFDSAVEKIKDIIPENFNGYESVTVESANNMIKEFSGRDIKVENTSRRSVMMAAAKLFEIDVNIVPEAVLANFKDADTVSDDELEAIAKLVAAGVIKGDGNGNLNLDSVMSNGEIATVLSRIAEMEG